MTAPTLLVSAASGNEDSWIDLEITASIPNGTLTISGIPAGASLQNAAGALTVANGAITFTAEGLTAGALDGLQIRAPLNSDADFALTVTASVTEGGSTVETSLALPVTVDPVDDEIYVDDPSAVRAVVETAGYGAEIYLPDEAFAIGQEIAVQSGVSIYGRQNTAITFASTDDIRSVFNVTGTTGVTIASMSVSLSHLGGLVRGSGVHDLTVRGVTAVGNMYQASTALEASAPVVYIEGGSNITLQDNLTVNTRGALYVLDATGTRFVGNINDHVNFGNIAFSGSDVVVSGNEVYSAGAPNQNGAIIMEGDGLTSLGIIGAIISDNVFWGGRCFQLNFWSGPAEDIVITHNHIEGGITAGVSFFTYALGAEITDNTFVENTHGVDLEYGGSGVTIIGNTFIEDAVWFSGAPTGVTLADNIGLTHLATIGTVASLDHSSAVVGDAVLADPGNLISLTGVQPAISVQIAVGAQVPAGMAVREALSAGDQTFLLFQVAETDASATSAYAYVEGRPTSPGAFTLTDSTLARLHFAAGAATGAQTIQVRGWDGLTWTAWREIILEIVAPVVQQSLAELHGADVFATAGGEVGADDLVVLDPLVTAVQFLDGDPGGGSAGLWLDGQAQGVALVTVDPADLGLVSFRAGTQPMTQNFYIRSATASTWSDWQRFSFRMQDAAPPDNASLVSVASQSLQGTAGADTLMGLGGGDSLTGGNGADVLVGDPGDDTLAGGAGADTLVGGQGRDVYEVDVLEDRVLEDAGEGTDLVYSKAASYQLSPDVEALVLMSGALVGIGNAGDNAIEGNAAANLLLGAGGSDVLLGWGDNDSLNGGSGADVLAGGAGNDGYWVDEIDDVVSELAGEGSADLVCSTTATYVIGDNVEHLVLLDGAVTGVGNGSDNWINGNAADNVLLGGAGRDSLLGQGGNDVLRGDGGVDVMVGGDGNDAYWVDEIDDGTIEAAGGGFDTVYTSAAAYGLGVEIENLVLLNGAVTGVGNGGSNRINGNAANNLLLGNAGDDTLLGEAGRDTLNGGAGADTLWGAAGADVLTGGSAADIFYFADPMDGGDQILDFEHGLDRFKLLGSAFGFTTGAALPAASFVSAAGMPVAGTTAASILYNMSAGTLWWDVDGTGTQAPTLLASLSGAPTLSVLDFMIVI